MNFTNAVTGQSVEFRADYLVVQPEGCLIVEAMFSNLVDLSSSSTNLAERMHPVKSLAFEWIVTGQCPFVVPTDAQENALGVSPGQPLKVIADVELHVNRPRAGTCVRHFSESLASNRELLTNGMSDNVLHTITMTGFEPTAEPIVREMRDGSLLSVFNCLPPLCTENDSKKAQRFNMNEFGGELETTIGPPIHWDDREGFVIPDADKDDIDQLRQFLMTYWDD